MLKSVPFVRLSNTVSLLVPWVFDMQYASRRKTFSFLNSVDVEAVNGGVFFGQILIVVVACYWAFLFEMPLFVARKLLYQREMPYLSLSAD